MKAPENWTVYCLKDPRTGTVRYVGWTSRNPKRRMSAHLTEAIHESRQAHTFKARWIRSLLAVDVRPVMEVLEIGTGMFWAPAEQRWIAFFRQQGTVLTNGSDGGEGNTGYIPPPEVRAKISQGNKGYKRSLEHVAKFSQAGCAARRGKPLSAEHREAIGRHFRGIPRPPEVIAKFHAKNKGKILSQETRAKIAASHRGLKASPETRAKMSKSRKLWFAKRKSASNSGLLSLWER